MKTNHTELLSFLDYPIEQFADHSARWLLEDKENVRGLFEIVAKHLVAHLDFNKLVHIKRSSIPDNLREQESDLVYTVPFHTETRTEELLIYILIEHQSTIDRSMGFRVLFYMTQIWDFQRREWDSNKTPRSERRLRPIIPIVFYTGNRKWRTPISLNTMMDLPDILSGFIPKYEILFLSVKETDTSELTRTDHPFGWLLTVLQKEHASKEEIRAALIEAVKHIDTVDTGDVKQWERAIFYLYLLVLHRRPPDEHDELKAIVHQHTKETSHREEREAMAQTMAEYLIEQGKKEGEKRGEKKGELRTKREDVLKLLRLRFDPIPEAITKKIYSTRSLSRLDTFFEKAATAKTLDEIVRG